MTEMSSSIMTNSLELQELELMVKSLFHLTFLLVVHRICYLNPLTSMTSLTSSPSS